MLLQRIADLFVACFQDAGVFKRQVPGASLIEAAECELDRKQWVVVCAGLSDSEAGVYFRKEPGRRDRALTPLTVTGGGQLSFAFVVRPFDRGRESAPEPPGVAPFAPGEGLAFVELRQGSFFRASNLEGNDIGVEHLRWELDVPGSLQQPREAWLRKWKIILGHNPAHSASHLHINSPPLDPSGSSEHRGEHSAADLRLGVGPPNPLALILSFAAWLRAGPGR